MKTAFKVGDKVTALDYYDGKKFKGVGTVIFADSTGCTISWPKSAGKGWADHLHENCWYFDNHFLRLHSASKRSVSVAADLTLKPQAKTVLRHLRKNGHISPAEALIVYGISRLAASIYDLRKVGYDIGMEMRHDAQGHKYARYTMAKVN